MIFSPAHVSLKSNHKPKGLDGFYEIPGHQTHLGSWKTMKTPDVMIWAINEQLKQKAKKNKFRKSFSPWKLPFRWWIYINLRHILVHILVHICAISHQKTSMSIPWNHHVSCLNHLKYMDVSENVVSTPLYPMVFMIIIPMKNGYFIGKINPTFSDKPK